MGNRLILERPKKWTGSRMPCSNWPEALSKLRIPFDAPRQQSAALPTPEEQAAISIHGRSSTNPHEPDLQELKSQAAISIEGRSSPNPCEPDLQELRSEVDLDERDRDFKERELEHVQSLLNETTTSQQEADCNRGSHVEAVNMKCEEARDQAKAQTEQFVALHVDEVTHKNKNQHPDPDPGNKQLIVENEKFKQTMTQMKQAADAESRALGELRSRLDTAEMRNQRMGDIMANSMDELISERKRSRALNERMESALQLEKTQREKAEKEVETLTQALAAARNQMYVPVSPGHDNAAIKSFKLEDYDA
jgi:hypothetical protein